MPRILITIGEFDKAARAYPVIVELPAMTKTRWLTKEETRGIWQPYPNPAAPLSSLLFQAVLHGFESDWNATYSLLSLNLVALPSGDLSSIRIDFEIKDRELNELPWELAAFTFGPNCQIVRYSEVPVAVAAPLQLPIEAIVIEGRSLLGVPTSQPAFSLDQTLRDVFGASADIPSVFRTTQVAGANDPDVAALVSGRRFDIVQLSARASPTNTARKPWPLERTDDSPEPNPNSLSASCMTCRPGLDRAGLSVPATSGTQSLREARENPKAMDVARASRPRR